MADVTSSSDPRPYVRVASKEDIPQVVDVMQRAFIRDPLFVYCNNVQQLTPNGMSEEDGQRLKVIFKYITTCTLALGGRIVVVVDPSLPKVDGREKICAAAIWEPPNVRVDIRLSTLSTFIASGLWNAFKVSGWTRFCRLGIENADKSHKESVKALKKKGIKRSATDNYWHLLLVMTDPNFQGKGLMSMIMREGLANAPTEIFGLEATTAKSRDQYAHLGYEVSNTPF
ncbi:hypothetical protein BKA70DRAFT_1266570 [Coprinopsis sp. MPI-PUGE-AT-0042]|nr:hypothetical protein BKA70DRAFT_1266570 [Coprinopsis sp. MPI-PUGE-AT-0042]